MAPPNESSLKKDKVGSGNHEPSVKQIKFTKNKSIDAFNVADNTIEICGWVDVLESPKLVGPDQKWNIIKFVLNNNSGKRIQCLAWQGEVERVKNIIASDQILHLRGAVASLIKKPQYNLGNVPLELIIREHTVIEVKGYYKETVDVNKTTVAVTWEEVGDMDQRCIEISGWLKMMFNETKHKTGDAMYSIGAMSDGTELKLAIRVMSSSSLPKTLFIGCAITVVGVLRYDGTNPYIQVLKGSDIKMAKQKAMDPDDLMDAALIPQKKQRRD